MERKQASDFDQELLNLFDQYVHGDIDRRGFLERAAKFAVGGVTAIMLLDALNPRFAEAQQIPKDDKRLATSTLELFWRNVITFYFSTLAQIIILTIFTHPVTSSSTN